MTGLKITTGSPRVLLPADEAVTRSFGILGMRGSGKSNAAVVLAEEFHNQGIPWIALDPKGDWWGIKSSADGKGPGLPVIVFGGPHADVALEPTAAAGVELADVLVAEGLTCIIDMSAWTKAGRIEFLAGRGSREGFAERLFRKHLPEHGPAHMFMEEAHDYLPQQAKGDVGKLVEVVQKFQSEGRTRGWGCSALSQRSARLHNDVLSQIDTLLAFRTMLPADRDAIEQWVKHHGVARELVRSLPELEDGECWLWSPEWGRRFLPATDQEEAGVRRIRFRRRETFDSGATPVRRKGSSKPRRVVMADVDLKALEQRMATAVEKAKEQDPEFLQRQIRELQRQLRARPTEKAEPEIVEKPVEIPVFADGELEQLERVLERYEALPRELSGAEAEASEVLVRLRAVGTTIVDYVQRAGGPVPERQARPGRAATTTRERPKAPQRPGRTPQRPTRDPTVPASSSDSFTPNPVEQKTLDGVAWLETVGIVPVDRAPLASVVGYHPATRSFRLGLAELNREGFVDFPQAGAVQLTDVGRAHAVFPEGPVNAKELQAMVMETLGDPRARILAELIEIYPESISRQDLADRLQYHPATRSYRLGLASLKSLKLVRFPAPGHVEALPVLFPEDAPA